jgi:putative endonuclease
MLPAVLTQVALRCLDRLKSAGALAGPPHQRTGRKGEEDAYFHLRRMGYVMVARNFRTALHRGEIDLIGWHRDVLCFIEVKSRTTRDVKPAEAAVDRDKQRELGRVARDYLRHLPGTPQWRFDIVSVYYEGHSSHPHFDVFENAFTVS